jgi:hypothetical protein
MCAGGCPGAVWSLWDSSLVLFCGSLLVGRLVAAAALRRVFRANASPPLCLRGFCESLWLVSQFRGGRSNLYTSSFVWSTLFNLCCVYFCLPAGGRVLVLLGFPC